MRYQLPIKLWTSDGLEIALDAAEAAGEFDPEEEYIPDGFDEDEEDFND